MGGKESGLDTIVAEQKHLEKMMGNMPAFPPCVCEMRIYNRINSNACILGKKAESIFSSPIYYCLL